MTIIIIQMDSAVWSFAKTSKQAIKYEKKNMTALQALLHPMIMRYFECAVNLDAKSLIRGNVCTYTHLCVYKGHSMTLERALHCFSNS